MTVRWGCLVFFGISALLAAVPFVAFWYGPVIRSHSKYSKQLMAEEAKRIETEKNGKDDAGDGAFELEQGREGEGLEERVEEDQETTRMNEVSEKGPRAGSYAST